jgi:hypothetical protein
VSFPDHDQLRAQYRSLTPAAVQAAAIDDMLDVAISAHAAGRDPVDLADPVRALHVTATFDSWVLNGGFYGFFFQVELDPELVAAGFEYLGEAECAHLVRQAAWRIRSGLARGSLAGRMGQLETRGATDAEGDRILDELFKDLDAAYWGLLKGEGHKRRNAWALAHLERFAG